MNIRIEKKYIAVPLNSNAVSKKLCFYAADGEERHLVMDFDCKLDALTPEYLAYLDVSHYRGCELEYESAPQMEFVLSQCEEKHLPGLWTEQYRPFVHFTPELGWINDPNGMILHRGVYHMFYQYNPCGTEWGNMHWGHAVSRDLLHWEERDIALFPDETGTMYSGSAIEDKDNVSDLQTGAEPPMLLFYTAAGGRNLLSKGKPRTQCLACSNDGGKTFAKCGEVLGWVESYNRDPKVVWVEELARYLMVLYLADDRYGLFVSETLREWSLLQEIRIANESECPDIHCHWVNHKKYWVIMGASDQYIIGSFSGGRFEQKSGPHRLSYSGFSYAGQSFSGLEDGRVVRVTWEKLKMPCARVPNQMSIPTELKLESTDQGMFLTANPVRELRNLYVSEAVFGPAERTDPVVVRLGQAAYDIHLVTDFGSDMKLELFGHTLTVSAGENCIRYGNIRIPLSSDHASVDLRIIADRCSFEIFADGGRFFASLLAVCDYNLPYLRLTAADGIRLRRLRCSQLAPIHGGEIQASARQG